MAKRSYPKIYEKTQPVKLGLKILFAVLLVLLVFAIFLFVYFQRFIVYTDDGVKLDIAGYYQQDAVSPEPSVSPGTE